MSFQNLKRNSGNLEKLSKAVEQLKSKDGNNNANFWHPELDKAGNGYAIIRFLPAPAVDGDDGLPWVKIFTHGFQGPGGWLIENCRTTLGIDDCPVCKYNTTLWNSGIESNKEIVRKQKRKLSYVANVMVIEDSKNPENEGKVVLFKFGKKIFDKLTEAMQPEFEDETPINPFDLWKGANFKLKIRKVEGYSNYDKSEFDEVSALLDGDDEKLEEIWKQEHSLKELVDPKNFKEPEQIQNRLDKVLGIGSAAPRSTVEHLKAEAASVQKKNVIQDVADEVDVPTEDDDLSYFSKLAEED